MPWGVPVPGDEEHVMYVWFDALVNYISTLGWPEKKENFEKFWPGAQVCGKDNLRQQSAMWQAMLMSAGVPNSTQIFVNGFITVGGQKMSKSLGNVISPYEMVEKFGIDATRYLLLVGSNFGEDFDITWEKLTEKYNADLANGLGNLVSRVVKLISDKKLNYEATSFREVFEHTANQHLEKADFNGLLENIWEHDISEANGFIDENKPWKLIKEDEKKFEEVMLNLMDKLTVIFEKIAPFMPETSEKIKTALETKKVEPLFLRMK